MIVELVKDYFKKEFKTFKEVNSGKERKFTDIDLWLFVGGVIIPVMLGWY